MQPNDNNYNLSETNIDKEFETDLNKDLYL